MSAEAQTLTTAIEAYSELHGIKYNEWTENGSRVNGKDILQKNIQAKFQEFKGAFRRKSTGERVDIDDVIKSELLAKHSGRPLITNTGKVGRYLSPFQPRTPEVLAEHSKRMVNLLKEEIKAAGTVFLTPEIENRFINTVAGNFLATDTPDGPKFHKVTSGGIVSPKSWTFDELGRTFGIHRFTDGDRTQLQRGLMEAKLKAEAATISGAKEGDPAFKATYDKILKVAKPSVGRTVKVDRLFLENEIEKETNIEQDINQFSTLQDLNRARGLRESKFEKINSLNDVAPLFDEIETILPQPQPWEGI